MEVLKDGESDKDEKFEELVQANNQLNDLVNELKQRLKDYVPQTDFDQVSTQMKDFEDKATNLKSENQKLIKIFDTLTKERDLAVEE